MREGYNTFYVINTVFQSIFTLLWQIGLSILVGWVFVTYVNAPDWIYVPLILAGVATGLVSMIRFILAAMKSLERLEEQSRKKKKYNDRRKDENEQKE